MRLSELQRKVLAAIELHAELPVPEVARRLKLRVHTVRYAIQRLTELGVLIGRVPFIDCWRCGYGQYTLHFSVSAARRQSRERLLTYLQRAPRVCWLSELGGRFQYAVLLLARKPSEVAAFLRELVEKTGVLVTQKAIVARLSFVTFPRRYIAATAAANPTVVLQDESPAVELDQTDERILSHLGRQYFVSEQAAASALGIPLATLNRRIAHLKQAQVLVRQLWSLDLAKLGVQRHRILLSVQGVNAALSKALRAFADERTEVTNFSTCLGSWDYEYAVETTSSAGLLDYTAALNDRFGAQIVHSEVEAMLRYHKFSFYPL